MSDGIDQGDGTVAKKKKGRGPTVARWQVAVQSCESADGAIGLKVLEPKYTSPEAALKAVQTEGLVLAKYVVRAIRTESMVTARLI